MTPEERIKQLESLAQKLVEALKYSGKQHSNALHGPDSGYESSCPICQALTEAKKLGLL